MKTLTMFLASLIVTMCLPTVVYATPIALSKSQFLAATHGLTTVIEDFEMFDVEEPYVEPRYVAPLTLANSIYTSTIPQIRLNESNNPTKALFENAPDPESGRVFSSFFQNTIFFGTDLNDIGTNDGVLDINVTGVSGVLNIQASFASLDSFFGVSDPLGLISVSFRNLGTEGQTWAWGLDNVITASVSVPEPTTMLLFTTGLAGLAGFKVRRKRKAIAIFESD